VFSFGTTALHAEPQNTATPLSGKKLRYKIGAEHPGKGRDGEIVEVGYDWSKPLPVGITIAYCNLFNEKYSEQNAKQRAEYGPYLKTSDTAAEYGEGQIDPRGPGEGASYGNASIMAVSSCVPVATPIFVVQCSREPGVPQPWPCEPNAYSVPGYQ